VVLDANKMELMEMAYLICKIPTSAANNVAAQTIKCFQLGGGESLLA